MQLEALIQETRGKLDTLPRESTVLVGALHSNQSRGIDKPNKSILPLLRDHTPAIYIIHIKFRCCLNLFKGSLKGLDHTLVKSVPKVLNKLEIIEIFFQFMRNSQDFCLSVLISQQYLIIIHLKFPPLFFLLTPPPLGDFLPVVFPLLISLALPAPPTAFSSLLNSSGSSPNSTAFPYGYFPIFAAPVCPSWYVCMANCPLRAFLTSPMPITLCCLTSSITSCVAASELLRPITTCLRASVTSYSSC